MGLMIGLYFRILDYFRLFTGDYSNQSSRPRQKKNMYLYISPFFHKPSGVRFYFTTVRSAALVRIWAYFLISQVLGSVRTSSNEEAENITVHPNRSRRFSSRITTLPDLGKSSAASLLVATTGRTSPGTALPASLVGACSSKTLLCLPWPRSAP